jgi:membrane-associated PAP2 superfamily phosphatase
MSDFTVAAGRPAGLRVEGEIAVCLTVIALFSLWPLVHLLDLAVQPFFFDASAGRWLIPPDDRGPQFLVFYKGVKIAFGIAGGGAVFWLIVRAARRRWSACDTRLAAALCVLALTPLIVGLLKKMTGVSCPAQELVFGGSYAHTAIWDRLIFLVPGNVHFRCWPAGHASAGFGLMGLRLLAPAAQRFGIHWLPGLGAGWGMGLYQMARGQHYLSHTIVTMMLAILLSSIALVILERTMTRVDRG